MAKEETREERMKRLNISDVPFHTHETELIQVERSGPISFDLDKQDSFEGPEAEIEVASE